ncbi:hypothetical protein [Halogeometricum limi]|uniref:Uncharacterized protein n=1 Tax=Halogeometricum limi TaxID=555875 RepID=A0A1I6HCA2_9EURY|nr:hypothetical protein [Halogeometricum limi]SFR51990.1 hypothetical protein SAMN04488124_2039 [Halogeometricum limi]
MSHADPDPTTRTLFVTLLGVLVALVATVFTPVLAGRPVDLRLPMLLRVKLFVSTFNVALLVALAYNYVRVYRDLPNPFTMSLVVFTLALLLYALTSNPLAAVLFGFRPTVSIGPFTFLPDLFAAVAVVVLLYQSYR